MKHVIINIFAFFGILILSFVAMKGIVLSNTQEDEKEKEDTRPTVSVENLFPTTHQVQITSFGAVEPLETTSLAAQVSGEVINWNPNFVAGGIVKRGEVLFSIEADAYEAEVLQAEAQVFNAESNLTEELARQKVAQKEAKNLPRSQVSDLYLRKPQVLSAEAQLKSAQAALKIAKLNLSKTQVTAPYDALVVSRDVGSGQFVSAGMKVAQLNNIEAAEIVIPVAGFDTPFLDANIEGNLAIIQGEGALDIRRQGEIARTTGIVDENTRMKHLVVSLNDPYALNSELQAIPFGSYVRVTFTGKEIKDVYKIPQTLVNKQKIWLVNENDELESHPVQIIRDEGVYFYVRADLSDNENWLAKNLPEYPQNGMAVKISVNEESNGAATSTVALSY